MNMWMIIITRFVNFIWINRIAVVALFAVIMTGFWIHDRARFVKVNRRFGS
jgi:hypothetical protein